MNIDTCANCGAAVTDAYCPKCGQKRATKISAKEVAKDIYDSLVDFESPFLKSLVYLTINPGKVYRDYLGGARKRYFSPIRYSLWILTLLIAVAAFDNVTIVDLSVAAQVPEEEDQVLLKIQDFLNATIIPLTFVMALWMAFITRLVFRQEGYGVAELFVTYLLNTSHMSLLNILLIVTGLYSMPTMAIPLMAVSVIYMTWGIGELYQPRRKGVFVKCALLALGGQVFFYGALTFAAGFAEGWFASRLG